MGSWLDGELGPAENEAVRAHVAGCSDCGEARRRMEKIQLTLANILKAESSRVEFAPLWREVERRINEKRSWREEAIEWFQSVFTAPRVAWAVPAAIVLVLGLFSLNKWQVSGQGNSFVAVESIDAYGRNVALLREDETKTTIIWLYQNPEGDNENADEAAKSGPSF